MRCNNCGLDYIADDANNCPRCGAFLGQPGNQQQSQQYQQASPQQYPDQQYQQPPQQQYAGQQPSQQYGGQQYQQQPQQGGYYSPPGYNQQPPAPPKRVPTVKRVDLTEMLIVVSGLFLLQGGIWNLSWIPHDILISELVLGLVATTVGLLALMTVLMPALFKQMDHILDNLILAFGVLFAIWGLIAAFSSNLGMAGDSVFVGGFGLMVAGLLRMGILK